ncbi:MAG: CHASE3 domain-containing protein, partial [Candidatus Acidiferrales bacterium]
LDAVQGGVTDAETGQRGYIITGQQAYLDPYNDALNHVDRNLKDLRALTADSAVQQRNLDLLEPMVATRLKQLQEFIDIRDSAGMDAAAGALREGSGMSTMDQIRAQIRKIRFEEDRLLKERSEETETSSRKTRAVIVAGDILALSFLFLAGIVVRQEIERRKRAEDSVRALNADLERRVIERTAQLDERAKDLARSNSELQQFAYVASHDLQEPLRMISSFTQLLAKRYKEKLDDDARDFINYAVDGATRMQTLISDLLSYSRVGTQGKPLERTLCGEVFGRALQNLKVAIEESGTVITTGTLPAVLADPQQMCQLFQNLIANAIKFRGKDAPIVHVSAVRNGDDWKISVRDNGIGIAPEHADRIFVIFQRLHTRTEYPGTGIGLAVCKKIVERHGGRIWVESSFGMGSTFCFTVPAAAETPKQQERRHHELRIPTSVG